MYKLDNEWKGRIIMRNGLIITLLLIAGCHSSINDSKIDRPQNTNNDAGIFESTPVIDCTSLTVEQLGCIKQMNVYNEYVPQCLELVMSGYDCSTDPGSVLNTLSENFLTCVSDNAKKLGCKK
jgi:hypothetical protein